MDQCIHDIYNHIRGLSPYPCAWAELISPEGEVFPVKVIQTSLENAEHNCPSGSIITDCKKTIKIAVKNGFINILFLQLAGKKPMAIEDFLRGFWIDNTWKCK